MLIRLFGLLLLSLSVSADDSRQAVNQVLDRLHQTAATADAQGYFELFTPDALYIGTDASEIWTLEEFKQFALPYFERGRGWVYTPSKRIITLSDDGTVAWFVELLWSESYGQSRGTGVLVKHPDGWKIAQYHLTFPIPNALAKEITDKIKQHANQTLSQ
jgi:ketosteroid isomerase-like protein